MLWTDSQSAALLRCLNPFCAPALEAAASLRQTRAYTEIQPEHWLLNLLPQRARGPLSNSLTQDTNEEGEVSFTF